MVKADNRGVTVSGPGLFLSSWGSEHSSTDLVCHRTFLAVAYCSAEITEG